MSDFRGPLPFDDRDFAEVRRNVLSKLERRPVAHMVMRFALAAAAIVVLVVVLLPRPHSRPHPAAKPPVAVHQPAPVVVAPAPAPRVAESPQPVRQLPKPPRKPELVASAGAPPSDSEITMNIETADPNVRIIWISR